MKDAEGGCQPDAEPHTRPRASCSARIGTNRYRAAGTSGRLLVAAGRRARPRMARLSAAPHGPAGPRPAEAPPAARGSGRAQIYGYRPPRSRIILRRASGRAHPSRTTSTASSGESVDSPTAESRSKSAGAGRGVAASCSRMGLPLGADLGARTACGALPRGAGGRPGPRPAPLAGQRRPVEPGSRKYQRSRPPDGGVLFRRSSVARWRGTLLAVRWARRTYQWPPDRR